MRFFGIRYFVMFITYCLFVTRLSGLRLKKRVSNLEAEVETLISVVQSLQEQVAVLEEQVETGGEEKERSFEGFSAYLEPKGSSHPILNQPIPYSVEHLDPGKNFNVSEYAYTCPVSGIYYFSFCMWTGPIQSLWVSVYDETSAILMQDDDVVLASAHCSNSFDKDIQVQCGNNILTHCAQGGKIWLKSGVNLNQMTNLNPWGYSTFNGFLLSAD